MVSKNLKCYCSDNIQQIENYDKAINDNTQMWECHHKLECILHLTPSQLMALNLYYNRPANELILLTKKEHINIHVIETKYRDNNKYYVYGNKLFYKLISYKSYENV